MALMAVILIRKLFSTSNVCLKVRFSFLLIGIARNFLITRYFYIQCIWNVHACIWLIIHNFFCGELSKKDALNKVIATNLRIIIIRHHWLSMIMIYATRQKANQRFYYSSHTMFKIFTLI